MTKDTAICRVTGTLGFKHQIWITLMLSLEDYHVDPVCTPTRAALMTGRYSSRVGAWAVTEGRQLLKADEVAMADVFANSGCRTGMFGK